MTARQTGATHKKQRRTLVQYGERGDLVRALIDTRRKRVEVKYRDLDGVKHVRTFADTAEGREEARTWALAYHTAREAERARREARARGERDGHEPITLAALWAAYAASPAYGDLREASRRNYRDRFAKWLAFLGPAAHPDETTLHDLDRFRVACTTAGLVLNTARQAINVVRIVYNWGQSRDLLGTNRVALYRWKQPKELPRGVTAGYEPGEYSPDEMDRMIAQLDPKRHDQWRGWVALMLMRHHGQRARAVLHLRLADFDFAADRLRWPGAHQKQGKDVVQPITWAAYAAYLTATQWRAREARLLAEREAGARVRGPDGRWAHDPAVPVPTLDGVPWLLFAQKQKTKPYSYSSLHHHLKQAEARAGIAPEKYRGAHGFRRGRVGEVIDVTGDRMLGLEAVGDTDPKMLKAYDKRRQQRIDQAFAAVDEARSAR